MPKIDRNRFGPSRLSADERHIAIGHSDKDDWITGIVDYVNSMKERYPDAIHPPDDWLLKGFSMISLDQGQSAATRSVPQGEYYAIRYALRDKVSQPLEEMRKTLGDHTRRHTANKL